jgi:rsbT co-antagonist protein RsbR
VIRWRSCPRRCWRCGADLLTVRLLTELSRTGARHAILDLTGAEMRDAAAIAALLRLVRSVALIGARCVITGVQPATAQALVELGADLSSIATQRNMQQALQQIVAGR